MKTYGLTLCLMSLIPAIGLADNFAMELRQPYQRSIIYDTPVWIPVDTLDVAEADSLPTVEVLDAFFEGEPITPAVEEIIVEDMGPSPLIPAYLRPAVFGGLQLLDPLPMEPAAHIPGGEWIEADRTAFDLIKLTRQHYIVNNPDRVNYIEWLLPEPPKKFTATIDPESARIVITEQPELVLPTDLLETKVERRHWLKTFNANLQFSQAYVSSNWYQGGNNNLNALAALFYNVKLNPAFHPNLLFESTLQYKLGITNAPEDELRAYSISEDLFQANATLGYKSVKWKNWYYSANFAFKTQFLNNYKTNTEVLKAAFMAPAELNVGLGMTYNFANPKKTVTLDASISPLSWNMKACLNTRVDETTVGLKEGHRVRNEYGSSAEVKFFWQICSNIAYRTRLFGFTDYTYVQSDWENTFMFTINKFLTTQVYVHARYDSKTPYNPDSKWHNVQLKEILSFGFTYKFSSL